MLSWINHYSAYSIVGFANSYPVDSILSGSSCVKAGLCYVSTDKMVSSG